MVWCRGLFSAWLALRACDRVHADCLPDAVPPSLRKELRSDTAEFPLGVWVNGNPQDLILSAIFEQLSQEMLGINVSVAQQPRRSVEDGFYALAGCEANESEWICYGAESRTHVMLGAFVVYNEAKFDEVQRLRVGGILERIGSEGYDFSQGLYLAGALAEKAAVEHDISLDFYRTYRNGSFGNLFAKVGDFDPADLIPCADWKLYDVEESKLQYLVLTGAEMFGNRVGR